jgi:hypothetical protein
MLYLEILAGPRSLELLMVLCVVRIAFFVVGDTEMLHSVFILDIEASRK